MFGGAGACEYSQPKPSARDIRRFQGNQLGLELGGLAAHICVRVGTEANDEEIGVRAHDFERLAARAPCRAQDGEATAADDER